MAWDPTKPADNSPLVSAEIRANWAALVPLLLPFVVPLPLEAARFPDGTAGNLFPQPVERISTGTPVAGVPKLLGLVYQFDAATAEWLIFKGTAPPGYTGGTATVVVKYTMLSATSGSIRVSAAIGAVVDGTTDARAIITGALAASADITVPATLGVQAEARVNLADLGGLASGRKFLLALSLGAGAVSSAAGDRVLEAAWLELAR